MNRKMTTSCGLTAVALTVFMLVACDNNSSSASVSQEEPASSAEVQPASSETATSSETVSSSATAESSSSPARCGAPVFNELKESCARITDVNCIPECTAEDPLEIKDCTTGETFVCDGGMWMLPSVSSSSTKGNSSSSGPIARCDALMPECGYTVEELCRMGATEYCASSSSIEGTSCEKENKSIVDGGRAYMCLHGVWVYMPAPTGDGLPLCRNSDADRQTLRQDLGEKTTRLLACDDGVTCQERISHVDFTPPDCSVTDCGNWDPPAVSEKVYYCGNGELYQEEEFLKKFHPVVYCYNSSVKHDGRTFKTIICEDGNMYMRSPNEANTDAELPQGVKVFAPKAGSDSAYNCIETGDVCIERNPNLSLEQDSLAGCHPVIDCPE